MFTELNQSIPNQNHFPKHNLLSDNINAGNLYKNYSVINQ
jgi:hypothetical protein